MLRIVQRPSFTNLSRYNCSGEITIIPAGWRSKMVEFDRGEEVEILFVSSILGFLTLL
jgi:hypothetical protein